MRFLKLYILFVLISLIIGVGKAFSTPIETAEIDKSIAENQNDEIVEIVSEPVKDIVVKGGPKTEVEVEAEEKAIEPEVVTENVEVKQEIKETPTNKTESFFSESSKKETEIIVDIQPWEELGLSEEEYYNQPIMKWQKVTHSNMDACKNEGQNTIDDENNEYINFWCYDVYSPSGNFLGVMLSLS